MTKTADIGTTQAPPSEPDVPDLLSLQAECRWLKTHYEQHLAAARAEIARLRTSLGGDDVHPEADMDDELRALRDEVARLKAGEKRYLDRIEELKDDLSSARRAGGAGQAR